MYYFVVRAWWGVGQAESAAICIAAATTCAWYNGHQLRGHWCWTASETVALQTHFQNEEGVRCQRAGSVLRHRAHWCCKQAERVLLLIVSEGCVRSHGGYEIIRHFQGHHHFARDQRLRLETPSWWVLDFDGNPLPEDELKRQCEKLRLAPLVAPDREYLFREDLIPDASGNVDQRLPILAKFLCLIDALRLGGS